MYLSRDTISTWAGRQQPGATRVKLDADDVMDRSTNGAAPYITGPGIVELTVYRDGGWSATPKLFETPGTIYWAAL
jgi:hypothetical protein